MFYTKHFYGFEKEGKCDYFQEKAVTGHFFKFKWLLNEQMIKDKLVESLNMPINDQDIKRLLPRTRAELKEEKEEACRLEDMLQRMSVREKRTYDRAQREKEAFDES